MRVSKKFLALWLCSALTAVCGAASVYAQEPKEKVTKEMLDYAAMSQRIDETNRSLEAVRNDLDRSRYETESLLDKLDYDADPVVAFVRDRIVFQPYAGALRGVRGTLRARSGNSLDQSMLLASLLKSAGFDARIVRGSLDETDALRLLRSLQSAEPAGSLEYLDQSIARHFSEAAAKPPEQIDISTTGPANTARALAGSLRDYLRENGIGLESTNVTARWLQRVRDYFWVQYRDGPSQEWQDAHPAFAAEAPPATLKAEEYFSDSIPDRYQHTLTVSAWIEQWVAGEVTRHEIMTPWKRPVANLDGVAIRYRNLPSGLKLENAGDLSAVLQDTQIFLPMLNDATAPGAMAFDLKGRAIDPMALSSGSGGVFQTMGNLMEKATGEVMDREDGQPVMALHSMWLEFTFSAPGGETFTQRRYLIAPRTDHSGDLEQLFWPLLTDHVYMVNAGGYPLDYLAERYLVTAIENGAWLKAMMHKFLYPDQGTPLPDNDLPVDFPPLAQFWFMDDNPLSEKGVVTFRAQPALLGLRRGFRDADTAFAAVDIVANRVEHLRVTDTGIESVPQAAMARGVWETALESLPKRALSVQAGAVASAADVFRLAAEQGIDLALVRPDQPNAIKALGLDPSVSGLLRADLEQGYAVVIPQHTPAGAAMPGWWRVDPRSGETLGMTGDGHGQELVEYLTDVVGIGFNMVQSLQALKDCDKLDNNVAKMCCLVEANINNVAGLGFGSLLGSAVGSAGGALFDILNYATGLATEAATGTAQGLMPQAKLGCEKMESNW